MTEIKEKISAARKNRKIYPEKNFSGLNFYKNLFKESIWKLLINTTIVIFFTVPVPASEMETGKNNKEKIEMISIITGTPEIFASEWIKNRFPDTVEINQARKKILEKKNAAGNRKKNLEKYLKCVKKFAPHWLEEFSALDKALGWPKNGYAEFNAPQWPVSSKTVERECTSWILFPELTGGKGIFLHKNRDASSRRLAVTMYQRPGCYRWLGGGNLYVIVPTFAINEKGLAVVVNNADCTNYNNDAGLSTPDMLRLVAEKCANVDEALTLLEEVIKANAYSHKKSGSIWIMADTKKGVVLENNAVYFTSAPVKFGLEVRANIWHLPGMAGFSDNTARQLLGDNHREYYVRCGLLESFRKNGKVTLEDIFHISRGRDGNIAEERFPVCWSNTNSAATFVPDTEFPDILSTAYISMGPPRNMVYLPIPMAATAIPKAMFNGEWAEIGHDFKDRAGMDYFRLDPTRFNRITALEKALLKEYAEIQAKARGLLHQGKRAEAIELLNRTLRKQSAKAFETIKRVAANTR